MKKAIREWAFNLFTRRITIKVSKLPDDAKIEFLVNKLMNELVAQGYDIRGCQGGCAEYFILCCFGEEFEIQFGANKLRLKRLTKI